MVAEELARLMSCVQRFSANGALQANIDIRYIQDSLKLYSNSTAKSFFNEALDAIPQLSEEGEKQVASVLSKIKQSMKLHMMCFSVQNPWILTSVLVLHVCGKVFRELDYDDQYMSAAGNKCAALNRKSSKKLYWKLNKFISLYSKLSNILIYSIFLCKISPKTTIFGLKQTFYLCLKMFCVIYNIHTGKIAYFTNFTFQQSKYSIV